MPTYKTLPSSKKSEELPLYRPIDDLVYSVWKKKDFLLPFVVVAVIALLGFVGFKSYVSHYESKASDLFNQGQLEAVIQQYGRSNAARLARMKLGKQALDTKDAKDFDKAIQWYGAVAEDQNAPPILKVAAVQNLALAYLKKGDAAKAVSLLDQLSKDPFNRTADYTQLLLAYATEVKGDTDAAKNLYKSLSEGASDAAIKDEAKERLSWIEKGNEKPSK